MKPLRQEMIEREARRAALARTDPTHYADALNRYLTAQGYTATPHRPGPASRSNPEPVPVAGDGREIRPVIVVGVDSSPGSYLAVDHAAIEAELRGWEIRLVHVQHPTLVRRTLFEQRDRGAALLAEMGERIRSRVPSLPVNTSLRVGLANELLAAESRGAGLTVLGNRGYSTVAGLLSPSVSMHVAIHAAGTVLVVRVPAWPPGTGWSERPVLVGVDGSPAATAALEFGLTEARLRGAQLLALHATREPVAVGARGRDPLAEGPLADAAEWAGAVRLRRRTVDTEPVEALVEASAHASAVVVGASGRGGTGALPGAVARALIHRAHCPVFIAHP